MAKKRFTDSDSPVSKFLTHSPTEQELVAVSSQQTIPNGYHVNPVYIENKTKRVQLVFQPSIYQRAKKAADADGLSLNEYLHRLIDENTNPIK